MNCTMNRTHLIPALVTCLLVALAPRAASAAEDAAQGQVVFRLDPGAPTSGGAWINNAEPATLDDGTKSLKIDTRGSAARWNTCVVTPLGLLKGGRDYVISLDYTVIGLVNPKCFFYMFVRSDTLGPGPDQWEKWVGESREAGTVTLKTTLPDADDFRLTVGVFQWGAMDLRSLVLREEMGWRHIPAEPKPGAPTAAVANVATGPAEFTIELPAPKEEKVVTVAGMSSDGPESPGARNNYRVLTDAINRARTEKASKLVLQKGVYHFPYACTIRFEDLEDFTFDGQGSELIFHQVTRYNEPYVRIGRCRRMVFRDIVLDWDWSDKPLATVGRVTDIAPDGSFFDIEFPDIEDRAQTERRKKFRWNYMFPIEEDTRVAATRDQQISHLDPTKFEMLSDNSLRVWPNSPRLFVKGQLYAVRHYEYEMDGFRLYDNKHLTLDGVILYSVPGGGYQVSNDQQYWQLINCKIVPRPGSGRVLSTASDGYHVKQSQGYMRMENCEMSHTGDDFLNIHDNVTTGIRVVDRKTLVAYNGNKWRTPFHVGDLVEFRNADMTPTGYASKIMVIDGNQTYMTFEDDFPQDLPANAVLLNRRYGTRNVVIRNCHFHHNRGRGAMMYFSNGLVENNRFEHTQSAAVHVGCWIEHRYAEGYGSSNLVFRSNTFERVNPKGTCMAAAIYLLGETPGGYTGCPVAQNVLIEGNLFLDCPGPAVLIANSRAVVVRGNTLRNPSPLPNPPSSMRGTFRVLHATDVRIAGNAWEPSPHVPRPGVDVDPDTTDTVAVEGNVIGERKP